MNDVMLFKKVTPFEAECIEVIRRIQEGKTKLWAAKGIHICCDDWYLRRIETADRLKWLQNMERAIEDPEDDDPLLPVDERIKRYNKNKKREEVE